MQSTLQICSPVRSNPRYLQQRIEGLEQELDNKRVQLFQSEEARLELEARLTGNSETPTTAVTDSMKQVECGGVGGIHEWLGLNGDSEGMSTEGKHHGHSSILDCGLCIFSMCWRLRNQIVPVFLETESQVD